MDPRYQRSVDVPEPPTNEDEDWHEIGTRSTVSMITKNPAAYDLPQSSDEDDDTAVPKRISPSLIIVVTILVIGVAVGVIVWSGYYSKPSGKYACATAVDKDGFDAEGNAVMFNFGHCNMDDVNDDIASKEIMNLPIPDYSKCAPSKELHSANLEEWYVQWGKCLDDTWRQPTIDAGGPQNPDMNTMPKLVDSLETSGTSCRTDSLDSSANSTAFYCALDDAIFIIKSQTGNIDRDLLTLFHEYSHHMSFGWGIKIDGRFFIDELYKRLPDSVKEARQVVLDRQKRREEQFMECSAVGMAAKNGVSEAALRGMIINNVTNPSHWGKGALQNIFDSGSKASSLGDCNTWRWSDSTVDS